MIVKSCGNGVRNYSKIKTE